MAAGKARGNTTVTWSHGRPGSATFSQGSRKGGRVCVRIYNDSVNANHKQNWEVQHLQGHSPALRATQTWSFSCYATPFATSFALRSYSLVRSLTHLLYHLQDWKNRPEPVRKPRLPVKPVRTGSGLPNLKFKFKFKKMKNFQKKLLKILQVATNLIMSNFFKYSFI